MKKVFLIVTSFLSVVYGQPPKDYFNSLNKIISDEKDSYSALNSLESASVASQNFDIKYYRCNWKVDPGLRYITGEVTSFYKITSAGNSIVYDLTDSLHVDSVKQRNTSLSFAQSDNGLIITFPASVAAGTFDSLTIYYQGIPPEAGLGSFVTSSHAGSPIIWTLSEPFGSRDWWPCKNGLDDKADSIDIIITCPASYSAASNGLRQSEIIKGNNKITHWKHRYPIASYLVCMAVTNYSEFDDSVQIENVMLPMQTFCYPENLSLFQSSTPIVLKTLQYYSSIFGPYPFIKEKYGHVQFGWGGGQEHQTSTFIVTPNETLMDHELAHQWFGDKITCGSWHDIWLNEGFATHLASMSFEKKYPDYIQATRKKEITNITSQPGGSVWVDDTTSENRIFYGRLSYTKGSHLLYMLRWILGDSVFFNGMRRYFNDSTIAFGFAKTDDFKRNMEAAGGKDLTEFFNDWFYGQGYPSYHVQWTQIGSDYVKIKMDQVTSHPSVSFFPLPVALQLKNATQQKTVVVNNTYNGEIFFENIGFVADSVIIDPDYWLISKNNTAEKVNDNITTENTVQVFPNPFNDAFNIYLHNFNVTQLSLHLYDSKGSLLLEKNMSTNGSLYTQINTQLFSKGAYIIKLKTSDGFNFVKKILKQ